MFELLGILFVFIGLILLILSIFLDFTTMMIIIGVYIFIILSTIIIAEKKKKATLNSKVDKEVNKLTIIDEKNNIKENNSFRNKIYHSDTEDDRKEENISGYTDKELDNYGLEEWQKKLVKEGKYKPWNFEEEDLEEDDYYSDDN